MTKLFHWFSLNDSKLGKNEDFTGVYRIDRDQHFAKPIHETIRPRDRIFIVHRLLETTPFSDLTQDVGYSKLIKEQVIKKAFSPHDSPSMAETVARRSKRTSVSNIQMQQEGRRLYLDRHWASFRNLFQKQPLDRIESYFCEKTALYFAFSGFYSTWLILFAIIGIGVMLYGMMTVESSTFVSEMCDMDKVMCPPCDQHCNYWKFGNETCGIIKFVYFFDNYSTIAYAFAISIWSVMFLEFWKRKNSALDYNWDLTRFNEDQKPIRPKYSRKATNARPNPTTGINEPYIPFSQRLPGHFFSWTFVVFSVLLVVAAVFAITVYRLAVEILVANAYRDGKSNGLKEHFSPSFISSVTSSVISLCVIIPMNSMYTYFAKKITERELPRTEEAYENSLALKVFCFQFVNFYSPLFYIAFFKNTFAGYPCKKSHNFKR